jgi:hypothetical protein
MGAGGLELSANSAGKSPDSDSGGSNSGNIQTGSSDASGPGSGPDAPTVDVGAAGDDPDLAAVIEAWPSLSPTVRGALAAMASAAVAKGDVTKPHRTKGKRGR